MCYDVKHNRASLGALFYYYLVLALVPSRYLAGVHLISYSIPIQSLLLHNPTLTPRAIMHNLMRKYIAINTEMALANRTLISATNANANSHGGFGSLLRLAGNQLRHPRKPNTTRKAAGASLPRRAAPGHLDPIHQREEVVVGAGEVGGEDEGEPAAGAGGRQGADFCVAAATKVAGARGFGVAGAEAWGRRCGEG